MSEFMRLFSLYASMKWTDKSLKMGGFMRLFSLYASMKWTEKSLKMFAKFATNL